MKNKKSFPNFFFHPNLPCRQAGPSGLIIILLLLLNVITIAQEQTILNGEFPIGSNLSGLPWRRTVDNYYESFDSSGMNIVFQYSNNDTKNYLGGYNVIGTNDDANDWIMYYATCYYTKWEAEQNQTDLTRVGVKHNGGTPAYWDSAWCWSTRNLVTPACSLIYGPHYRQDNRYKSWQHAGGREHVNYYARFRMALENSEGLDSTLQVCKISVVYRYATIYSDDPDDYIIQDTTFLTRTLTVGDFPNSEELTYFDFNGASYVYPDTFQLPKYPDKEDPLNNGYPKFDDSRSDQGIQFFVDWLIDNQEESSINLFVDHIEVFDRDWLEYLNPLTQNDVVDKIQDYALDYSSWENLKYWSGHDEPYSIDAFAPIRIVDSILYNNPQLPYKHRLLQTFNPYWTYDEKINGDTLLCQYVRMAKPEKLFIDFYPFSPSYPFRTQDAEALRFRFQLCSQLQPGFWYMGQGFGESYWNGNQ
jgi:hypothetical protein